MVIYDQDTGLCQFFSEYILKYTYDLTKKVAKASDYVYTFLFHCYLRTSSLDLVEKNLFQRTRNVLHHVVTSGSKKPNYRNLIEVNPSCADICQKHGKLQKSD